MQLLPAYSHNLSFRNSEGENVSVVALGMQGGYNPIYIGMIGDTQCCGSAEVMGTISYSHIIGLLKVHHVSIIRLRHLPDWAGVENRRFYRTMVDRLNEENPESFSIELHWPDNYPLLILNIRDVELFKQWKDME